MSELCKLEKAFYSRSVGSLSSAYDPVELHVRVRCRLWTSAQAQHGELFVWVIADAVQCARRTDKASVVDEFELRSRRQVFHPY